MPGMEKDTQNEVKELLDGEVVTKKKPKLHPKSHVKRKTDCLNKSKEKHSLKREITIKSFLNKTKSLNKSRKDKSRITTLEESGRDQKDANSRKDKSQITTLEESGRDQKDANSRRFRKRKRKQKRNMEELDEASRLQRRTRYLLLKMKLEQNLIDAYSTEGWKGQSREKIKPDKELQRARIQILKCKLGIRDAVRQLDVLSSTGRINDSVVATDGAVHHEYIICAKCKLREAFPDNDIILCDGTCNCAFHQKCLDPPLLTENIPPGDEGWFCKFCKSKMEILEATNAHLGTHFALDSNWQDIFKEEAVSPDGGGSLLCPEQEWPSDESDDDDYDPEKIENSCNRSISTSESSDDSDVSSSLGSLEDEVLFLTGRSEKNIEVFEDGAAAESITTRLDSDCEILSGSRHRPSVDYIRLNDEMFGKNTPIEEQISEDEDWGPTKWKRRRKGTFMVHCEKKSEDEEQESAEEKEKESFGKTKRSFFRIPVHAVEQLRIVFAENELPSRAVRENLAKRLGLESEKVNKWFKNARYSALKARKGDEEKSCERINFTLSEPAKIASADPVASPNTMSKKARKLKQSDETINTCLQREGETLQSPADNMMAAVDSDDDVSLKFLRDKATKEKKRIKRQKRAIEAETDLEKLCRLEGRIEKLQQVLLGLPNGRSNNKTAASSSMNESTIIFVPVADLKVKR